MNLRLLPPSFPKTSIRLTGIRTTGRFLRSFSHTEEETLRQRETSERKRTRGVQRTLVPESLGFWLGMRPCNHNSLVPRLPPLRREEPGNEAKRKRVWLAGRAEMHAVAQHAQAGIEFVEQLTQLHAQGNLGYGPNHSLIAYCLTILQYNNNGVCDNNVQINPTLKQQNA